MGREIVKVPEGWEHPKDEGGEFIEGAHYDAFEEIDPQKRVHLQVYENTSGGTPVSPVFSSEKELIEWLVAQGHTREGAEAFVQRGSAPSFGVVGGQVTNGVEMTARMRAGVEAPPRRRDNDTKKLIFWFFAAAIWLAFYFFWLRPKLHNP